ncbi:hypothetical protein MLD38_015496 [Melastoma candidum]|uniref:Uncharacterized protein n=1 Tax=Melastoma candidum TaxID=119954 RepID=A0ACB9RJE5_9MYRT|nr:hypothetical protein MLD38_015496 [Melastoma candidum]
MHRMSSDGESAFLGVIKNVWFCFIAVRQAESNLDSQKRVAGFGYQKFSCSYYFWDPSFFQTPDPFQGVTGKSN